MFFWLLNAVRRARNVAVILAGELTRTAGEPVSVAGILGHQPDGDQRNPEPAIRRRYTIRNPANKLTNSGNYAVDGDAINSSSRDRDSAARCPQPHATGNTDGDLGGTFSTLNGSLNHP